MQILLSVMTFLFLSSSAQAQDTTKCFTNMETEKRTGSVRYIPNSEKVKAYKGRKDKHGYVVRSVTYTISTQSADVLDLMMAITPTFSEEVCFVGEESEFPIDLTSTHMTFRFNAKEAYIK